MSELDLSARLFETRRENARWACALYDANLSMHKRMAEALGVEWVEPADPPDIARARLLAIQQSGTEKIEVITAKVRTHKLQALQESRRTVQLPGDGTKVTNHQGDPHGAADERRRLLAARGAQATRHQEMAQKAWIPQDADAAHASTRDARAQMYRRWQEERDAGDS